MLRRTSFLGSLSALAVAGIVPILAACNGHVVLGNTGDTLQAVTSTKAAAEVNPPSNAAITCATGWAHPNVCCSAGPDVASSCGAWEQNPFRKCATGSTTYPNLLSCCDLSDPTKCVDSSPPSTSLPPPPPPSYGCGFACPPGWWAESGGAIPVSSSGDVGSGSGAGSSGGGNGGGTSGSSSGGATSSSSSGSGGSSGSGDGNIGGYSGAMCCTTYGTGTQCVPQGGANTVSVEPSCVVGVGGSSSGGGGGIALDGGIAFADDAAAPPPLEAGVGPIPDDAGYPVWTDDGGCYPTVDAGTPYPSYDGGTAGLCDPCPTGWTASDPTQPELCCQTVPGKLTLCFSQASGPATYVGGDDGGSSVPPTSVGPVGSSGWGSGAGSSPDGGVGGPNCSGSDSSCSCEETTNGHTYALDCFATSSGAITCSCAIDGTTTGATPTVDSCQDSTAVPNAFSAANGCGFPLSDLAASDH